MIFENVLDKLLFTTLIFQIVWNVAECLPSGSKNEGIIQVCGFRSESDEPPFGHNRIVGGKEADKKEFQWQVSIRLRSGSKRHMCGGAVIGKIWVLTAAHCTEGYGPKSLHFVAGDHSLNAPDGTEQVRNADKFIMHRKYNRNTQENDISLVRLSTPYDFSTFAVAPVCLPDPQQQFSGSCVVTGWGKTTEGGRNADVLRKVWVPIVPDRKCKRDLKKIGYTSKMSNTMICAGLNKGGKDACQGDSGGPFVCAGKANLPMLVGVVSWGIGCARKGVPGVYTEVAHFVDWINQNIKSNTPRSSIVTFTDYTDRDAFYLAQSEQQHKRTQIPTQSPDEEFSFAQFVKYPELSPPRIYWDTLSQDKEPSLLNIHGIKQGTPPKKYDQESHSDYKQPTNLGNVQDASPPRRGGYQPMVDSGFQSTNFGQVEDFSPPRKSGYQPQQPTKITHNRHHPFVSHIPVLNIPGLRPIVQRTKLSSSSEESNESREHFQSSESSESESDEK